MCRFNPWLALRRLRSWTVEWFDTDEDVLGECDYTRQSIRLARGQSWAQRRCTLAHELLHQQRGMVHPALMDREEFIVRQMVARQLIPLSALLNTLSRFTDLAAAADVLGVDVPTLTDRCEFLDLQLLAPFRQLGLVPAALPLRDPFIVATAPARTLLRDLRVAGVDYGFDITAADVDADEVEVARTA
jgi:hypothetical protein